MTKEIAGYEGLYTISDDGIVFSIKRNKYLKQDTTNSKHTQYKRVTLSNNGFIKKYSVHRLVAIAFIDNPLNKCCVNHKDNNGSNNYYNNLEWSTNKENMLHSETQGRQVKSHYLGGKASGKIQSDKAIIKWNNQIGKQYHNIVVKSIVSIGKHTRGLVECLLCHSEYETQLGNIVNGKTKSCRSCSAKDGHKNRLKI